MSTSSPAVGTPPADETPGRPSSTALARANAVEIVAAALLALATVATAWSGYQSARWSGVQTVAFSSANSSRLESTRWATRAGQLTQIDVGAFLAWVNAYSQGDDRQTTFLFERFRPPLKRATEAWIALKPLENASAPATPFAMTQYRLPEQTRADRLAAAAAASVDEAKSANQRSDNYVLAAVLFATVLFFAGILTKFESLGVRMGLLGLGAVLFVGTLTWVATMPVTVSL